ncbi:hypothetical protein [Burkholderia multivorans]|uniref:hypothetical protein n=1 Tax=Burkholderia multivorans TaxID=87883 RepID=UPI002ED699E8
MMKTYARIDKGIVMEIIAPATDDSGNEIPIEERFTPELVAQMIDITGVSPQPQCWWTYSEGKFSPPEVST